MSNNTILKPLERMGFMGRMTGHAFRGVASTTLHESGGHLNEHIEVQLAHLTFNKITKAYNYAEYLAPRSKMMQDWADFLERKPINCVTCCSRQGATMHWAIYSKCQSHGPVLNVS